MTWRLLEGEVARLVSAVKGYFGWMYINGKVVVYVTRSLVTKGDVDYGYIKKEDIRWAR